MMKRPDVLPDANFLSKPGHRAEGVLGGAQSGNFPVSAEDFRRFAREMGDREPGDQVDHAKARISSLRGAGCKLSESAGMDGRATGTELGDA